MFLRNDKSTYKCYSKRKYVNPIIASFIQETTNEPLSRRNILKDFERLTLNEVNVNLNYYDNTTTNFLEEKNVIISNNILNKQILPSRSHKIQKIKRINNDKKYNPKIPLSIKSILNINNPIRALYQETLLDRFMPNQCYALVPYQVPKFELMKTQYQVQLGNTSLNENNNNNTNDDDDNYNINKLKQMTISQYS